MTGYASLRGAVREQVAFTLIHEECEPSLS